MKLPEAMEGSAETSVAGRETRRVSFDGWILDPTTGELWKEGAGQRLPEQPRQILVELLARPGELVTREELIVRLWPRVVVDFDTGLNTAVRKLRLALGDTASEPRYIETLPRKGYRFIGRIDSEPVNGSVSRPQPPLLSRFGVSWVASVTALAAVTGAVLVWRASTTIRPVNSSGAALARELLLTAQQRQPEISPNEGGEPRRRLIELIDRTLALDPSLAPAHVVRARVQLDAFASNVDVGDATLAGIRADLAAAQRLTGDVSAGIDVQAQYAFLVDRDPERALRLLEAVPDDADAQRARAVILYGIGRLQDSDAIFDRFLALDPDNQRLARLRISNLIVEGRGAEALRSIAALARNGGTAGRMPDSIAFGITGRTDFARVPLDRLEQSLRAPDADGEGLSRALPDLMLLRAERRYDDERRLLDATTAASFRVRMLTGALPGLGRQPVALLRGWNAMLRGDVARAATHAADVKVFVQQQRVTQYNDWLLVMLDAQASLLQGDRAAATELARRALRTGPPLTHVHVAIFRDYLAAQTLAWAGERDEAVALLRRISGDVPVAMPPALITREPLFVAPLTGHAGFEALRADLERRLQANAGG